MNYFHRLLMLALFTSTFWIKSSTSHYYPARQWAQKTLSYASDDEINFIANLLYFSYCHSASTLAVQKAFLEHLTATLTIGSIINETRLHPDKTVSCSFEETYSTSAKKLEYHIGEYLYFNNLYTQCVKTLNNDFLSTPLYHAIMKLREEVRNIVINDLSYEFENLDHTFKMVKELLNITNQNMQRQEYLRTKGVLSWIWSLIPSTMLDTFASFDTKYGNIMDKLGETLKKAIHCNNYMWYVIETARTRWYADYYSALYHHIAQSRSPQLCLTQAFNEEGFIAPSYRTQYLPAPETFLKA